jgi:hypothetical protein
MVQLRKIMIEFCKKKLMAIGQAGKKRVSNNLSDNFGHNKPSEYYPNTLPPTLPLPYIFFKDLRMYTIYIYIYIYTQR